MSNWLDAANPYRNVTFEDPHLGFRPLQKDCPQQRVQAPSQKETSTLEKSKFLPPKRFHRLLDVSCDPNPCQNGGVCESGLQGLSCKCRGFVGKFCTVDVDECRDNNPCHNGGTCINTPGAFSCLCPGISKYPLEDTEKITCYFREHNRSEL